MYNEGAPEFVVDHGLYYPSATNYGYVCTGFESLGDWDDHHRVFGMEGQDHFIGAQTENLPYVYYTPSYGYAQSPYNPYNPYIPGALIGADGSLVGAQQYYITSYENGESSPVYYPVVVQSGPDTFTSSMADQLIDTAAFAVNGVDASGFMRNPASASATFTTNPGRGISNHSNPFLRVSDGLKSNGGSTKLPAAHGGLISNGLSSQASSEVLQGRGAQSIENSSNGRTFSNRNQLKVALSSGDGLSNMGSSGNGRVAVDKVRPKFPFSRITNDVNGNPDASTEQNRGPRTNKSKTRLTVKAYSTRAGNSDANGNIIICPDQYNKDDFPLEYVNAKFFVIKSYSEDDVHKSIKYNVWSSTTNGNKKLNSAYEDARKNAECCPIFFFFSVNASGQFCGVAEMIGPVDFHKDMDFWQQGKWSGSFPVKWHIIKDVPNPNFRHIILENNEYKPVTNSRDTQEILYKKGVEMLKVFKNYVSKTSVLDDFMYYENRQKILHEERSRFLIKNYGAPLFAPALDPPRKLNISFDLPSNEDEKIAKPNDLDSPNSLNSTNGNDDNKQVFDKNTIEGDELKIGSLAISPKRTTPKHLESTIAGGGDVLTFGSMPVKVNGLAESSGFLTVGTIPLDPKLLKPNDASASTKTGSQKE